MDESYLDQYRTQGFAVVKSVFDAGEVRELAAAFDRVYAEGLKHGRSWRHGNIFYRVAQDANLGPVVRFAQWPSYFDETLERFRLDRRLFDLLSPLLGRDMKQIINQLHWKPPGAEMVDFGFHQDIKSRRPREAYRGLPNSYVQTGIAVDPHRKENGALSFLPGSHLMGEIPINAAQPTMDREMCDEDLIGHGLDPAALVTLELDPGDVALWTVLTVHGSGPNTADYDRRLYINGYVSAADCDRGEWAFRDGEPCTLGAPVLVHYEELRERPEPHYVDD